MRTDTTTRRHHRPAAAILAITIVALLGGCLAGADTAPKSGPGSSGLLRAVRAASHSEEDGFDRVVFEFTDAVPPWSVQYIAKPVIADPSGMTVTVAGDFVVQVRMHPGSGHDPETGLPTYTGPTRVATGTPEVTELVQTGDFEAVLSWVVGTRHRVPFRVTTLSAPPRLVVDLAHG